MRQELRITLLGGVDITLGSDPVTGFVSGKAEALLCYLAVDDRSHRRETLAEMFWGNAREADAKTSLRQVLSNLRKLVGAHFTITRKTVTFNHGLSNWLDVAAFQTLLRAGEEGDEKVITSLQQAVALYQGDFLAGFYVDDAPAFEMRRRRSSRGLADRR